MFFQFTNNVILSLQVGFKTVFGNEKEAIFEMIHCKNE